MLDWDFINSSSDENPFKYSCVKMGCMELVLVLIMLYFDFEVALRLIHFQSNERHIKMCICTSLIPYRSCWDLMPCLMQWAPGNQKYALCPGHTECYCYVYVGGLFSGFGMVMLNCKRAGIENVQSGLRRDYLIPSVYSNGRFFDVKLRWFL